MHCAACRVGTLEPAHTTFEANGITMRRVPAHVCDNCGEAYLADPLITFLDRLTTAAPEGCLFCSDRRWICEVHSELPWPHDQCRSSGIPCPVCSGDAGAQLPDEWRSIQRLV